MNYLIFSHEINYKKKYNSFIKQSIITFVAGLFIKSRSGGGLINLARLRVKKYKDNLIHTVYISFGGDASTSDETFLGGV